MGNTLILCKNNTSNILNSEGKAQKSLTSIADTAILFF